MLSQRFLVHRPAAEREYRLGGPSIEVTGDIGAFTIAGEGGGLPGGAAASAAGVATGFGGTSIAPQWRSGG